MVSGLPEPTEGNIRFKGQSILGLDVSATRDYRRAVQMIFQDPCESLNPRFRIADIVAEGPRALVMEPEVIIADDPLSMLDVSLRAGILGLLREMQAQRGFLSIHVSHDLSILGNVADRLLVMYLSQAMEIDDA